jgi:hypothetical protein
MGVMEDHPSGWLPHPPFEGPSGFDRTDQPKGNYC